MNIQFISAGAGSGKTYKLMELISSEIEKGCLPEHIIATTFTKKAAEEIRSRLKQWFLEKGDFDKAGAAGAVNIGTVNSICGKMVSDFSFEAGLSPDLKVCEKIEATAILKKVTGSKLDTSILSEFNALEWKFGIKTHKDSKWQDHLSAIISDARSYRIDPLQVAAMGKQNAEAMLKVIGVPLCDSDARIISILENMIPDMELSQKQKEIGTTTTYIKQCQELVSALKKGNSSWDQWIKLEKSSPGKACGKQGGEITQELGSWHTHPRFHSDVCQYLNLLYTTASSVMSLYAEEKERTGKMDFTDQEVRLYDLLEKPEIRKQISERLDILLVDEFQDTSPIQLALFLRLAELAKKTIWIGDVKQAIYGFRGSDSTLMNSILESFGNENNTVTILPDSWRSRPVLVNLCNEIFSLAFSDELGSKQVKLNPKRNEIPGKHYISWNLEGTVPDHPLSLAAGIQNLMKSGLQILDRETNELRAPIWSDIAVLCRTNKTGDSVRQGCRMAGIPLRSSGMGLLATPEAKLLIACLRRLNDREDTLSSAMILGFSSGLSPEDWLPERLQAVEAGQSNDLSQWLCSGENADPVLAALEEIRPLSANLGPLELLDSIIVRCHLEDCILGWTSEENRSRERLSNLEAFRGLVHKYENESVEAAISLAGLILWLVKQADGLDELPPSVIDGITVSTWHGAKGLEWPIVICHESWKEIKNGVWDSVKTISSGKFDIQNPLAGSFIRFWSWPWGKLKNIDGLDYSADPLVASLETQAMREERRLLYVGCTRARDLLVVTHANKIPDKPGYNSLGEEGIKLFLSPSDSATYSLNDAILVQSNDDAQTPINQIYWFPHSGKPFEFPLAAIIPSDHSVGSVSVKIQKTEVYGVSIPRNIKEDIRIAGVHYHNAFAFFANNPDYSGPHDFPSGYRESVLALVTLLQKMFPGSQLHTELSVAINIGNGQHIDARLDLLLETKEGFHIIDHKLFEKKVPNYEELAVKYAGQLALYRQAVVGKSEKPVLGLWLNFPQDGVIVDVGII